MVFPGIIRKLNKNLPALLQTIIFICLIHYVAQSLLSKVNLKMHSTHVRQKASPTQRPAPRMVGRPSTRGAGVSFSRVPPRPSRSTSTTTTTSTTTPLPPVSDDLMEKEQRRRLETLHKACSRWHFGLWSNGTSSNVTEEEKAALASLPKSPLYQALLVSEKHHLAVCPVARNGIQWLARRLLKLTGKFEEYQLYRLQEPPSAIARHHFSYLSSWEKYPIVLSKSVTMLMARHPFDRLLASYRHILEDPEKNPHGYLHYGRRIVRTYRQAPHPSKAPTFEEFVRFLLAHDSHHLEEAWQSTLRRCTPCHIKYNMVIHYETLWHDVQWVWKQAGLGSLNTTDYVVYHLTPEVRRQYFSELTVAQILELYKKYKLDFQLYGYTLEEHMAYANPGEEVLDPVLMADLPRANPDHLQNILKEAEDEARLKKDQENLEKKQILNPESAISSMDLVLTGDRGSPGEVSNDVEAAGDYEQLSPKD
ncbi:carbohydrate sulfotransferase 10-like [Panulirus ornatus]|uniref:carbohydrate sulfotransferase 10-like n=1 Tax=Panulirus ornatus TaxID=150431 RepID=UPI003A83E916